MRALDIIAKVAANSIQKQTGNDDSEDGVARFLLDRLTGAQVAEICNIVLADPILGEKCEIKIPRGLVIDETVPDHIVTDEKTTHFRHANCSKPILILANTNDDQAESLSNIMRIGATELKASEQWISVASQGLNLDEEDLGHWKKALIACQRADDNSLDSFAEYVAMTRQRLKEEGVPLTTALGWALPALQLPRDSAYFDGLNIKVRGQIARWQRLYEQARSKRRRSLSKETTTGKPIENSELFEAFKNAREHIDPLNYDLIENYLAAEGGWTSEAEKLALCEWERDGISLLFSGLKARKLDISSATLQLFADEYSDALSPQEVEYVKSLKDSKKEPSEEDSEFYEKYRTELEQDKQLKAKWDKFVYGQPIECTDFLVGLVQVVERFRDQIEKSGSGSELLIRTNKQKSRSKWMELNSDVGSYFATKYRGLPELLGPKVKWDVGYLMEFPSFLAEQLQKGKAAKGKKKKSEPNKSMARTAVEIKFLFELKTPNEGSLQTQMIWKSNPAAIGMDLRQDLLRLIRTLPLRNLEIYRELSNKKGRLQGLNLEDVSTMSAAFGQDKGSLVGKDDKNADLNRLIPERIRQGVKEKRITATAALSLEKSWNDFRDNYKEALQDFYAGAGLASSYILEQLDLYEKLLRELLANAPGDTNRSELIDPILGIGCVNIRGGETAAIVAPWNPLRLAAMAVKARQVAGLVRFILELGNVDFGDSRVFFSDVCNEIIHPYYPEVCLGHKNQMPELLAATATQNDYTLMERPIKDQSNFVINDDPNNSAELIGSLVQRYLELMPHERTNFSLALYNCDSIRLPQAVVNTLANLLNSQDDARCQIILRHNDTKKLFDLYRQLLEASDSNPDALVLSEVSKDYIARLRISITAEPIPEPDINGGKSTDIVFLQDAISRRSKENWERLTTSEQEPNILTHVPPRWSYRRPAVKDDLKSTAYLTCPSQPTAGRRYLQALHAVCRGGEYVESETYLPAREISFKDDETQKIINDVHKLGEWVANVDDILERRQLSNQKIRVIKYQQSRSKKGNLIVSSTSSLSILLVLVKRRLESLNLGLNDEEIRLLADRLIDEANQLSGDIVLRAAKNGQFASELIGVCLSKIILRSEVEENTPVGWYFLDDYASWMGQKEGRIADLMVMAPNFTEGKWRLDLLISECKYTDFSIFPEQARTSQKQLRETVDRISSALFGTPSRLDRDLWLSRLADLLLTGVEILPTHNVDLDKFRFGIRDGSIPINLRGYSHVFVSGPNDSDVKAERNEIGKTAGCYQEIYGREEVRQILLAYHRNKSFESTRDKLGGDKPWLEVKARLPEERVLWAKAVEQRFAKSEAPLAIEEDEPLDETLGNEVEDALASLVKDPPLLVTPAPSAINETVEHLQSLEVAQQNDKALPVAAAETSVINDTEANMPFGQWLERSSLRHQSTQDDLAWLEQTVVKLSSALRSYDLQSKVLGQRLTPNAALVRFQGSDRLSVEDVEKRVSKLLTTHGLNIISVSGQPGEVLIAVSRPHRETISLRTLWQKREVNRGPSGLNLSFLVGVKEIDGELLYLNLGGPFAGLQQHAPHTLIAGATGSGKSVLLQNLLLDICVTNKPELAHIYLIDPKAGVDYSLLEDLPNLVKGIIVDQSVAIKTLEELVVEMDRRYFLFKDQKVKDLASYNAKVVGSERLPALFLVHDEFAEWMLIDDYKSAVSTGVQRLGVKARAAGIYLIFAAQRPDANVLPIQLRDNLGNRLILRVESVGTSEITLGEKGAERLLGKGHLAARLVGEPSLIFGQVPFLTELETEEVVKILKEVPLATII